MVTPSVISGHDRFVVICVIALCIMLGFFVAVMACENPEWVFKLFGKHDKFEILKFLGVGMGGVLLAIGAVIANRRAKAMEVAAQEQAQANRNTEQGQRQERLKNAIEHLGHGSESVRLGGAYELFHLARDEERMETVEPVETEVLRRTVLEILCAYIRRTTEEGEYRETHKSRPSEEIQSLLTLLFVQNHKVFKGLDVNLRESWLNGASLAGARLVGATLTQTRLQGAFLLNARLQGALLRDANLQLADLRNTRLQGAVLHSAKLHGAHMNNARLQGASLGGARLQEANLEGADLRGAKEWMDHLTSEEQQRRGPVQDYQLFSRASVPTFAERIRKSVGKPTSDLFGVMFAGGLRQEDMDSLVEGLCDEKAKELRMILKSHIDQPTRRHLPPENSGAIIGTYTEEEAETWIAEYETDM